MVEVLFTDGAVRLYDADLVHNWKGNLVLTKGPPGSRHDVTSLNPSEVRHYSYIDKLTPKQIAAKLLGAMDATPHGSRKLCEIAGIEHSEIIVPILKKLRDVGKVVLVEGKWRRA